MGEKNAPAKIWATPTRETFENATWDRGEFYEDERQADGLGVQYVRADSHDKLVEALKAAKVVIEMMDRPAGIGSEVAVALDARCAKIDAALASLQAQEEGR